MSVSGIPEEHPALEQIAVNCIANVLGLGWAATPAGLKAMEELSALEEDRHREDIIPVKEGVMRPRSRVVPPGTASDEMCTFLVLNISSLQLIPVNIIAYRSQYGSVDPAAIIGPAIVATMVSTGVGVIFCLFMQKILRLTVVSQRIFQNESVFTYISFISSSRTLAAFMVPKSCGAIAMTGIEPACF